MSRVWRSRSLPGNFDWEGELVAYWEVLLDPISDPFTPEEKSADDLLQHWATQVALECPTGLVPIYWFVEGGGKFERVPFQYEHHPDLPADEDFLTFHTWPVDAASGAPLSWLKLPVVDKLWAPGSARKGGFIQQATGWKPTILQPHVYLPSLLQTRRPS